MTPKFRATIDNTKQLRDIQNIGLDIYAQDIDKYYEWVEKLGDGTHVFITVEKITKRKSRSIQQNSYYWGVVIEMLAMEICGANDKITKQEMHDGLRRKFLSFENIKGLPTMMSTTQLSTVEFELYMENIRRWASSFVGLIIPEPNQVDWT